MTEMKSVAMPVAQRPLWQEIVAVTAYPLSFVLAVSAYLYAVGHGYPKWVGAYIPIIVFAVLLLPILERLMPHRMDWRPGTREYLTDTLYVFIIQIAMPPLLGLLVVLGLSNMARPDQFATLWPHHWPILGQGILMVLSVDFMRYWVHRFAHTNPTLWRLHAVHHSPDKLYWLNTARFHPLEKSLHFVFDSIPFILLGANEYVLGFYFVCYSVNGFFQHCNVYLRFGPLNYLFSTAELHRWHHSKTIQEANHNYSNTTIVWDWVFGTYFRPKGRNLVRAGIQNDAYPMSFGRQLLAPFVKGLDSRDIFVPSLREAAMNVLLKLGFALIGMTKWRPLELASSKPVAVEQWQVLRRILRQNQDTAFGKRHQFAAISSIEQFQRHCPVQSYDALRPDIEVQDRDGLKTLTAEGTVFFSKTSGTTGAAKLLPVTPTMMARIANQQALAAYLQYRTCPRAFRGALLGIVGAAEEGRTESGRSFGAVSGVMYAQLPWLMRRKFVVPEAVLSIRDPQTKYLLILRLALAEKGMTYFATANPSTFTLLLELAHRHWEELASGIETGRWPDERQLPLEVSRAVEGKLRGDPARAAELRELFSTRQQVMFKDLWPYAELVATWTGGNCQIPLQAIKRQLPEQALVMDLGFMASECRITLVMDANTSSGLPVFDDFFFEFVERERKQEEAPPFLTLDQLKPGCEYYLFVTTPAGLYRYDMNDVVRVTGFWHAVPLIEFLQKGRGVTNITGEKLYEAQVAQAMSDLTHAMPEIAFLILLANREVGRYELFVEGVSSTQELDALGLSFDAALCQRNEEYKDKRSSGRLQPAQARLLKPGTALRYRDHLVESGQKDAQLKPPCLLYKDQAGFDFDAHAKKPGDL